MEKLLWHYYGAITIATLHALKYIHTVVVLSSTCMFLTANMKVLLLSEIITRLQDLI